MIMMRKWKGVCERARKRGRENRFSVQSEPKVMKPNDFF